MIRLYYGTIRLFSPDYEKPMEEHSVKKHNRHNLKISGENLE